MQTLLGTCFQTWSNKRTISFLSYLADLVRDLLADLVIDGLADGFSLDPLELLHLDLLALPDVDGFALDLCDSLADSLLGADFLLIGDPGRDGFASGNEHKKRV